MGAVGAWPLTPEHTADCTLKPCQPDLRSIEDLLPQTLNSADQRQPLHAISRSVISKESLKELKTKRATVTPFWWALLVLFKVRYPPKRSIMITY